MNSKIRNIIIGSLAAIITAGIIVFAIETDKSFLQILGGFIVFILPFTFISSFKSKTGSFIFVFATILVTYLVCKYLLPDFWLGVAEAAVIGGAAFYYRIYKYKPFSTSEYKKKAFEEHNKNK